MSFVSKDGARFAALRNDRLDLRLLPTEQCNFRCAYCYETFEHKRMNSSVVAGVKALMERRSASLNELHLDWFGGEPMTAFDIVKDISQYARKLSKTHGFQLTSAMTTNGYFLDQHRFQECLDHDIRSFQITFDGGKDSHDAVRVLGSGEGTFDRIWSNVVAMQTLTERFSILLRIHYTRESVEHVVAFAGALAANFSGDDRFKVYFRPVSRLGGPNDAHIAVLTRDERAAIEERLWQAFGKPQKAATDDLYVCYASHANSLVIRSNGKLSKCTVALNDDFNIVGELNADGEIIADQNKFQRWIAPVLEGRWDDVGCPLSFVAQRARAGSLGAS